jgi:hypothetical protein
MDLVAALVATNNAIVSFTSLLPGLKMVKLK